MEQAEEGLNVLAEMLTVIDNSGERYYEAELYRLKGELLLKCVTLDAPQSEVCLHGVCLEYVSEPVTSNAVVT